MCNEVPASPSQWIFISQVLTPVLAESKSQARFRKQGWPGQFGPTPVPAPKAFRGDGSPRGQHSGGPDTGDYPLRHFIGGNQQHDEANSSNQPSDHVTIQVVGRALPPAMQERRLALGPGSAGEWPRAAGETPAPLPAQSPGSRRSLPPTITRPGRGFRFRSSMPRWAC